MEKFIILVQQNVKSWFEGSVEIEAENYEEALKIAKNYTQEELQYKVSWDGSLGQLEDDGDITISED